MGEFSDFFRPREIVLYIFFIRNIYDDCTFNAILLIENLSVGFYNDVQIDYTFKKYCDIYIIYTVYVMFFSFDSVLEKNVHCHNLVLVCLVLFFYNIHV